MMKSAAGIHSIQPVSFYLKYSPGYALHKHKLLIFISINRMKKFNFLLIALLLTLSSNAQLALESFESWPTDQGPPNWKVLQNNVGTDNKWVQTTAGFQPTPPHTGSHSAYMNAQNVVTGMPEDYLVTPVFNSPVNGRIYFYSRLTQVLDQGSIYKVKILPEGANADDLSAYVELQSWTELEINPTQTEYTKVTVEIPAVYENTDIRVAFVLVSDAGDRWLIDDVEVLSQCLAPTDVALNTVTLDTAELSWLDPAGAGKWEIEVLESWEAATGNGVTYNGTLPYTISSLQPGTEYKVLVRTICVDGNESDWTDAFTFSTATPGQSCQYSKVIASLPYTDTDDTANYFDFIDGKPGNNGCGTTGNQNYLNGNDIIYAYTATQNGVISINVTDISEAYAGIFVYTSCADIGVNCQAGAVNDHTSPAQDLNIEQISISAGTTYYIVISNWFGQTTGFKLNIQLESCDKPTDLAAVNATTEGITLQWTENGTAASWEYKLQPVGTGLPMGNGQFTNTNDVTVNNLDPTTQYEVYVRSACGDGTFSGWTGPVKFSTVCEAFTVPYIESFETNSVSQFCWKINDGNGDNNIWDLDFTYDAYEGEQSAKFDVSMTTDNDDMLISPAIMLTGNERLRFFYKTQQFGAAAFRVLASTTGNNPSDFTIELSPLTSYAVDNFTEKTISLAGLPSGPVYLAWHVPAGFNGGYELMLDNIIVEPMPACANPTDGVVTNVSNNGANFAWTAGNTETQWEIVYGQPDVLGTPGASTPGTPWSQTNYNISGLDPNTLYAVHVRAVCGTTKSLWNGPYYFTTKCDAYDVPFTEGFNSDSATEGCWTIVNANGDWSEWNLTDGEPFEGDEAATFYAGNAQNNDWLISPAVNLTGNERLKFHYKVSDAFANNGFKVMLSTSGTDLTSFTEVLIPETTYNNEGYLVNIVPLTAYSGSVYIAWQVPPAFEFGSDITIDNIVIEPLPSCAEPLYIEISDVQQSSAEVTWQPGGTETEWELFVYEAGQTEPATGITVNSLPYTITALPDGTPLNPGTPYEVSVKAVCSPTEKSNLSDKAKFITLISNDECDNAVTIPVNSGPACQVYAMGTLNNATASPQTNTCGDWMTIDNDVWFEFTATSSLHTISIIDVTPATQFWFAVYEGDDCGTMTQIGYCMTASWEYGLDASTAILENLSIGGKYKVRVFTSSPADEDVTFKMCVKTPVTPISVSATEYTVEELVTDVLFKGECTQISNITWSTGTNYPDPSNPLGDNPNGIAYFNQNGSGFPFEEGVVMATGNVMNVPGPNYRSLEGGSSSWLGDTDIDQVMEGFLGAPPLWPSTNASIIEFDFVPSSPTLSLDFLFASKEYGDLIQCYTWDTFVVLLTDNAGNTQNIAVIPGTDIPISVFNISGDAYPGHCPGYNLEWFDKYNVFGQQDYSPTAFAGQTKVMTATADNLVADQQYHLKIAIAESDNNLDSGVFIKAGFIDGGGEVDLGVDMTVAGGNAICEGETVTLNTNLDPATFEFVWKKDNITIDGETTSTLTVSEPGTYTVNANIAGYNCVREDSVVVEFYPSVDAATGIPADLRICDEDGFADFDLTLNTPVVLNGLNPADYTVSYHISADDAEADTAALPSPFTNTVEDSQAIYVRIENIANGCHTVKLFNIIAHYNAPEFTLDGAVEACRAEDITITINPDGFDLDDAAIAWTLNGNPFAGNQNSIEATEFGTYQAAVTVDGCTSTKEVTITRSENVEVTITDGCEDNVYIVRANDADGSFNPDTATYEWTGPNGFSSPERAFAAPLPGIYNVTVTTEEGCTGEAEIIVTETTCFIPRGISPNNDGKNDELDLSALGVKKISIYNRYGQEVYSKNNYSKEWRGQDANGNDLPTGTYFYVIERTQGESKTGWIYINRQE